MQPRDRSVRPPQVDAHQPGKHHADEHSGQAQTVILLADHLVIEAKNVFPDETRRRPVVCRRVR